MLEKTVIVRPTCFKEKWVRDWPILGEDITNPKKNQ
jgi:hypothetical protein